MSRNQACVTHFIVSCQRRSTPDQIRWNPEKAGFERVHPIARTKTQRVRRELRRFWNWMAGDGSSVLEAQRDDPDRIALGPNCDGFLFEIRGRHYCHSVEAFGQTVRRVLTTLSALDTSYNANSLATRPMYKPPHIVRFGTSLVRSFGRSCVWFLMVSVWLCVWFVLFVFCVVNTQIAHDRWHFELMHEPMTVTSFAPCYGPHNSRYAFTSLDTTTVPDHEVSCFVMLQPESSFVWHDMGAGVTRSGTNWERPQTMREKIRVKFVAAGRDYAIAEDNEGALPAAQHIVRTEHLNDEPLRWYIPTQIEPEVRSPPHQQTAPSADDDSDTKSAADTSAASAAAGSGGVTSRTGSGGSGGDHKSDPVPSAAAGTAQSTAPTDDAKSHTKTD